MARVPKLWLWRDRLSGLLARMGGRIRPGTERYKKHVREELDHYTQMYGSGDGGRERLIEPSPAIWEELQRRAQARIAAATGRTLIEHAAARAGAGARFLSLGCGPGGVELAIAREAPGARYHCIDLNEELLRLGEASAHAEGLAMRFEQGDLNTIRLERGGYDLVFCHASLHHVLKLEELLDQIGGALRPGGELIAVDVVPENGYRIRRANREAVRNVFATLPERFRLNHTAYLPHKWVDDRIWESDTRQSGMECARSGEILRLLDERFERRVFVGYFALSRRLFDTMYGPNYDLERRLDQAILDWIWELDCDGIDEGRLEPETFFGIYGPR